MEWRLARKMMPVMKPQTTYSSLIPLEEWLVLKETNEICFEDGKRKLVGLGWEDKQLGGDIGWGSKEWEKAGEGLQDMLVERYKMRHRGIFECQLSGVDKDKLSKDQLRELICCKESGPKVVNQHNKLYVSVLSLGPNCVRSRTAEELKEKKRDQKSSGGASEKGVEVELPAGVVFGPQPKITEICTRINRKTPDQRLKSKSQRNRLRLVRQAREKREREERLKRKELL